MNFVVIPTALLKQSATLRSEKVSAIPSTTYASSDSGFHFFSAPFSYESDHHPKREKGKRVQVTGNAESIKVKYI